MEQNQKMDGYMGIGYAFVPNQPYQGTYEPLEALQSGTAFPILDLPFGVYEKANWEGECP